MPTHPRVQELVDLSRSRDIEHENVFEEYVFDVITFIDSSPQSDHIKERLLDALDRFQSAWRLNLRAWNLAQRNSDPVRAHLRGEPNGFQTHCALARAREWFERLMSIISQPIVRQDGYTVLELRAEAGIGSSSWQKVLNNTPIAQTRRGDSDRRFTFEEIRKLAATAAHVLPRIGEHASEQWLALIARNQAA